MVFDAREVAERQADNSPPFHFIGLDGETYELPHPRRVSTRQAQRFAAGDLEVVQEVAPDAYEAWIDLPVGVAEQLTGAWMRHGGESGKSLSASSRTSRASKPQKPTSRSAG